MVLGHLEFWIFNPTVAHPRLTPHSVKYCYQLCMEIYVVLGVNGTGKQTWTTSLVIYLYTKYSMTNYMFKSFLLFRLCSYINIIVCDRWLFPFCMDYGVQSIPTTIVWEKWRKINKNFIIHSIYMHKTIP